MMKFDVLLSLATCHFDTLHYEKKKKKKQKKKKQNKTSMQYKDFLALKLKIYPFFDILVCTQHTRRGGSNEYTPSVF